MKRFPSAGRKKLWRSRRLTKHRNFFDGCELYLEPAEIGCGLYLEPAEIGCGLYLEPAGI